MNLPEPGFQYKTDPFPFQREILRASAGRKYAAFFNDQGTGKTKLVIDTAAYQYLRGWINGLLIVAPSGVHFNWADEEIPKHMSDNVGWKCLVWDAGKAGNASTIAEFKRLLNFKGLAILCINIESITTKRGKAAAKTFLMKRKVLFEIDESQDIASAGAKRTITIRALGKYAAARRITSGTAARDGSPLDLYPQLQFLSEDILKCGSYLAYKHTYAEWKKTDFNGRLRKAIEIIAKDGLGNPKYKNLDQLNRLMAPHVFRVLKDDVLKDLPPKVYSKRHFRLSSEQQRMYREVLENRQTRFDTGEYVTADLTIVRDLRLQQIICGYVPVDPVGLDEEGDAPDLQPEKLIPGPNPRLDLLMETLNEGRLKTIVWCRFLMDVELISERLKKAGLGYITYTGRDSAAHKRTAVRRFEEDPAMRVYIATGGRRGLTITNVQTHIFYSNYFALEPRVQAEDRTHRIGLKNPLDIIDLLAYNTIDEKLVRSLRAKKSYAATIMGDPQKEWI